MLLFFLLSLGEAFIGQTEGRKSSVTQFILHENGLIGPAEGTSRPFVELERLGEKCC